MTINLPLMENNIIEEDLNLVIQHLSQKDPKLTQGPNVSEFEKEWSKWLGVKYSVFVNSGSSANQLTLAALKLEHPEGGDVIVPPLTWISDIAAVLQAGFNPIFIDIDPFHLQIVFLLFSHKNKLKIFVNMHEPKVIVHDLVHHSNHQIFHLRH